MSEHELREGLRSAVADEPPLAFDADRLVERAERGLRRRRSLVAAGAATFLVVAAAVSVPLTLGARPGLVPAAAPGITVTSTGTAATSTGPVTTPPGPTPTGDRHIPWPPTGTTAVDYSAGQLAADAGRLTEHLVKTFPAVAPGARKVVVGPWGAESAVPVGTQRRELSSTVRFLRGDAESTIIVEVDGPGTDDRFTPESVCTQGSTTCQAKPGPAGGEVVVVAYADGDGRLTQAVYDFRTDGTLVFATAYNYDVTLQSEPITTKQAALSTAELSELAADPDLHL
jgi:hypothetical protein